MLNFIAIDLQLYNIQHYVSLIFFGHSVDELRCMMLQSTDSVAEATFPC